MDDGPEDGKATPPSEARAAEGPTKRRRRWKGPDMDAVRFETPVTRANFEQLFGTLKVALSLSLHATHSSRNCYDPRTH